MMFERIKIPGAYALWSPQLEDGYVSGTVGLTRQAARTLLIDRKANGQAHKGERVRPVYVTVQLIGMPTAHSDGNANRLQGFLI